MLVNLFHNLWLLGAAELIGFVPFSYELTSLKSNFTWIYNFLETWNYINSSCNRGILSCLPPRLHNPSIFSFATPKFIGKTSNDQPISNDRKTTIGHNRYYSFQACKPVYKSRQSPIEWTSKRRVKSSHNYLRINYSSPSFPSALEAN